MSWLLQRKHITNDFFSCHQVAVAIWVELPTYGLKGKGLKWYAKQEIKNASNNSNESYTGLRFWCNETHNKHKEERRLGKIFFLGINLLPSVKTDWEQDSNSQTWLAEKGMEILSQERNKNASDYSNEGCTRFWCNKNTQNVQRTGEHGIQVTKKSLY